MTAKSLPKVSNWLSRRAVLRLGLAGLVWPRFFTRAAQAASQETETPAFARFMAYPQHALLNLSAASPKKTRTRAVRLTGSVAVPAYEVQCALAHQNS